MRTKDLEPSFRERRAADDPFLVALGAEVFGRWSRDAALVVRRMLEGPRSSTVTAELEGQPIGFAVIEVQALGRRFGPWPSPKVARLDAIAVAPRLHGVGVGVGLLAAAEDLARAKGAVVMRLMTATTNGNGRRLFASASYMRIYCVANCYANGDDAIEMFKPLVRVPRMAPRPRSP